MFKESGYFSLARFLPRLKSERLVARRFRDGITLPISAGYMGAVIQFNKRHDAKVGTVADDKVRDLSIEAGPNGPAGPPRQFAVIRQKCRKGHLREDAVVGQCSFEAVKELRLVRGQQWFALDPGKPRPA